MSNNWKSTLMSALNDHKYLFSQLWRVLAWEKPFHPVVTFLSVTIFFWIIAISKASVISSFAGIGIFFVAVDFGGPAIYSSLEPYFGPDRAADYESFCAYLSLPMKLLNDGINKAVEMKRRQKALVSLSIGAALFVLSLLGRVNNYYLCYLIMLLYLMAPGGLKRAGISIPEVDSRPTSSFGTSSYTSPSSLTSPSTTPAPPRPMTSSPSAPSPLGKTPSSSSIGGPDKKDEKDEDDD